MIKDTFDFPYCHEVSKYEKIAKVGQGTFGLEALLDVNLPPFWRG